MNLIPLSVIRQLFAPYWDTLGRPILDAADAAGKLRSLMKANILGIRSLSESGENIKALTDAMDRLITRKAGIMDEINIAEREGRKRTPEVDNWLKRVEAEAGESAKIEVAKMEESCRKRKRPLGVSFNWDSSYIESQRVRKKAKVVEELQTEASSIITTRRLPPSSVQEMPIIPRMVGIESYKNEVLLHLANDSMGIIAIRGMGGVGKTTLLREVNNSFLPGSERSSEFDHVIWTVASKECTLEKLQKGIAQKLGLNLEGSTRRPNSVLFEYLRCKNFLLLLDDMWRGFELEDVGIPRPGTGGNIQYKRKVILTTRLQNVCSKMRADVEIKMECLGQPEALDLFRFHVGEHTLISHPDIIELAGVVAEECRGLPLALKTIGSAMRDRREPKHWRHVIQLLKEAKPAEIQEMEILPAEEGEERDMFLILKLSYDNLPDDMTRQCFLSCCLWPEDYSIEKADLIDCWMGLGLIDEPNENSFWGHEYIRIMEEACLLEPSVDKRRVGMHDVIRDLALWIASDCGRTKNKWLVQADVGLREAMDVKRKWIGAEEVERISLMENEIEMLPQYLPNRPHLKVLMLQWNRHLRSIPPYFFQCMPSLTYLDLSGTALEELPKEIGMLVHLQYLNLSRTFIKALPKELACLEELKYLLLRNTWCLKRIPRGGISNLSKLRQLDLCGSNHVEWEPVGSRGGGDTASFEELEGLNSKVMSLTNLGITVDKVRTLQMLSSLDSIVTRYLHIRIACSSAFIQLTPSAVKAQLGSLKMLKSLQKLTIDGSADSDHLVDGEDQDHHMDWQLPDLEELQLVNLLKLKVVKWRRVSISDFLPQLRKVTIHFCPQLENANWVLLLPQLESLSIAHCDKMRQVIDDSVSNNSALAFRCLRILHLEMLCSLTSICDQAISFPSLEIIGITLCHKLKQLPVKIMGSNLRAIWGSEGWWQSLQWQDENVKASLLPFFWRLPPPPLLEMPTIPRMAGIESHKNERLLPSSVQEMPNIPRMVGMESYINEVMRSLANDSMGTIAIWGMGGVGKTTLLTEVKDSFLPGSERSSEFDHVIWTVASKGCTLEKLQKGIAQKLGLNLEAYAQPANLVLFENLKSKNFLLLLDDMWTGFKLEDVGIPRPGTGGNQHKRKVILTTRLQNVCRKMRADVEIKMNCLGQPEALDLFKFHVGEQTLNSHPHIIDLAGVVAEECRGLPLALRTVGSAMRDCREPKHWRHVIKLLKDSKHAEIQEMEILPEEGEEREMFRILKLSYDNLPDDRTRQCFLSCCLWPEDCSIEKGELIECWMGLDLIDELNGNLLCGHECIRILEEACLLEPTADEERVRMHDVIRDLALWIASDCGRKRNKWFVQAGVGLKDAIDVREKWTVAEAAERISLMRNHMEIMPQYLSHRPSLKVLMLQVNTSLGWIAPDLFYCMPALTYLDLSHTILEELPKEIDRLVQLQYLNLSQTCIKELPKELACLKELKYLLLSYTIDLRRIPRGGISNLSKLRQLDLFGSNYKSWDVEGSRGCGNEKNTASWGELEDLNSKVMLLTNLGITVEGVSTLRILSWLDKIVTRYLCINCVGNSASIKLTPTFVQAQLGSLKMLKSLQKLMIKFCQSLVELEVDGEDHDHDMDWKLPDLKELRLWCLRRLKVVKWRRVSISDFLPQLREVTIDCCDELENANWVLLLPELESLKIWFCPKMRQVIDDSVGSHAGYNSVLAFRCLRILELEYLDSLTSICDQAISFASLEIIEIKDCDELKQLPIKIMGSNLREIRGSEGWWRSLQWQDENVRASLLPRFKGNY